MKHFRPRFRFWVILATFLTSFLGGLYKLLTHSPQGKKKSKRKQHGFHFHLVHPKDHLKKFQFRRIRKKTYPCLRFLKETKKTSFLLGGLVMLGMLSSNFFQDYSHLFRASLIGLEEVEFTGTVSPVEKVPNWVELTLEERKMTYNQIPKNKFIELPEYNLQDFKEGMHWEAHNEHQRNAYVSYPVPNLGNYKLDGTENTGSHTGVDIKLPVGTPIRSIANGVVYKVDNAPSGFGHHIVVAHVGIPDPENSERKTTLFSAYAHLSEVLVSEGVKVSKGQVLGKSGQSGMATAPHLHFQIDRSDAPFHPYWPFSWKDVEKAGLGSYFEAVKRGLGKSNAERYTIHPVEYVVAYENYIAPNLMASVVNIQPQTPPKDIEPAEKAPEVFEQTVDVDTQEKQNDVSARPSGNLDLEFDTDRTFIPGQEKLVTLRINDQRLLTSVVEISSTLRNQADVAPYRLTAADFRDGVAQVRVKTNSDSTFKIIAQGEFGEIRSTSLRAQVFTDVDPSDSQADAIKYLKQQGIVDGYPDGTFRPEGTLNRAEAVKILLFSQDTPVEKGQSSFPDVEQNQWFNDYVYTAVKQNIVSGYADGTFKPGNIITRAEFLKVALLTAGVEISENQLPRDPYDDVPKDAWFAPYFDFAKSHNLLSLKRGGYIVPQDPITRGEAAELIYELSKIRTR